MHEEKNERENSRKTIFDLREMNRLENVWLFRFEKKIH